MSVIDIVKLLLIAVISYAIGNINPSIIIGKIKNIDIRNEGSGNAGMTNTIRVMGLKPGLVVLAVDVLKGFIAVRVGYYFSDNYGAMTAFAAVVLGHCYPVVYKFKGGKGVAAALGAALAMNWLSAFASLIVAGVLFLASRRMSVASLGAVLTYPFFIWFYEPEYLPFSIVAALFLVFKHADNIKRLFRGEEEPLTIGRKGRSDKE